MCAGLGLIFGIMRVINFAQGDFMMLAMYAGLNGVALLAPGRTWAFATAMGVAVLVALLFYGIGTATHYVLVSRVSGAKVLGSLDGGHTGQLILTLGLSLVLQNGGLMLFGSTPVSIGNAAADTSWMLDMTDDVTLGGARPSRPPTHGAGGDPAGDRGGRGAGAAGRDIAGR